MTVEISEKLTEIETLYSEQEYTIQMLNDIVTRQDKEISRLNNDLQWLKQQLLDLREQMPDAGIASTNEVPPHY
ncbi:MAG: SlyX family protein [Aestuariibacter sp.]|nr:SlyX family protein [Aestuariibacter sp.]